MRTFLTAVRNAFPSLQGVILVGAFPEAMLVRLFLWRKDNLDFQVGDTMHHGVSILCATPEIVAHRADLVLGDLTGNWDALYREASGIPSWEAMPSADDRRLAAGQHHFHVHGVHLRDPFLRGLFLDQGCRVRTAGLSP